MARRPPPVVGLNKQLSINKIAGAKILETVAGGKKFKKYVWAESRTAFTPAPLVPFYMELGTPNLNTAWEITNFSFAFYEIKTQVTLFGAGATTLEQFQFALIPELLIGSYIVGAEAAPPMVIQEKPPAEGSTKVHQFRVSGGINFAQPPIVPGGQTLGLQFGLKDLLGNVEREEPVAEEPPVPRFFAIARPAKEGELGAESPLSIGVVSFGYNRK